MQCDGDMLQHHWQAGSRAALRQQLAVQLLAKHCFDMVCYVTECIVTLALMLWLDW
jgi:hypothetical protein